MKKKFILVCFIVIILLFFSENIFAKTIYEVNNTFENENSLFIESNFCEIDDDILSLITGQVICLNVESTGQSPKVYALLVGTKKFAAETSSGLISTDNGSMYLFMIVWPDGVVTFQSINPYTGEGLIPINTNYTFTTY
ncbi:MAG: hypothetical protein NUV32_10515 [Exilispira sp.]|jgi:hypothetical protein|nr:hypothetical protein [Exilispira sp.]